MGIYESPEEFRFADVAVDRPRLGTDPSAPLELEPQRKTRMLHYLRNCSAVLDDPGTRGPDLLDPAGPVAVPRGYRTDGDWIWPDAVTYYLKNHDVPPPVEFAVLMSERGYVTPLATAGRVGQARALLASRPISAWEPAPPVQSRFPADVYDVLVTYGWSPGRTVADQVETWWRGLNSGPVPLPVTEELARAGCAMLAEFGGLRVPVYGSGPDWPVVGFVLQPYRQPPDPVLLTAAVLRVGGPLFPLGLVPEWRAEIVLHSEYGVLAVGDIDRYLGRDLEQALVALVHGAAPAVEARS